VRSVDRIASSRSTCTQPRIGSVGAPSKKTVLQEEELRTATQKRSEQRSNEKDGHQRVSMTDSTDKNIQINEIESQSTREFFDCDLFNTLPYFKDDMASMEHPVFSLTTQVDKRILRYEHNGNTLTIKTGYDGLPTIHSFSNSYPHIVYAGDI